MSPFRQGSSLNGMMAHYGAASDFDEWAQIIKDDSWSSKHFYHHIRKFEHYIPNADYPSVNPADHGDCGPVEVGFPAYVTSTNRAFIETCPNVGIPMSGDLNTNTGKRGAARVCQTYL
jgi:choline dehydrogenase